MSKVARLDAGHRLGGVHAPRPRAGTAGSSARSRPPASIASRAARRGGPKREHVEFFASGEEARAAGYRACLRCKPDEVGRDREAVAKAVKLIEQAEEAPSLAELAEAVGYAPHHFQRLFKRDLGVSPAEYARGLRNRRAEAALKAERPCDRRGLRRRLFEPERLLQRCEGEARHDPIGVARRRARRDDPLDALRQPARARC